MKNINQYRNRFYNLMESTMGDVKPLINEDEMAGWSAVKKSLMGTSPKVINFNYNGKPITSLNWGSHKSPGFKWGLSLSSDSGIKFQTDIESNTKIFSDKVKQAGLPFNKSSFFNDESKRWSTRIDLDYSDPQKIITLIKDIINSMVNK